MSHSILLVQPNKRQDSRSYADFESVNEAMEGICKIYEEQLKKENPDHQSITYDIRYIALRHRVQNFFQISTPQLSSGFTEAASNNARSLVRDFLMTKIDKSNPLRKNKYLLFLKNGPKNLS